MDTKTVVSEVGNQVGKVGKLVDGLIKKAWSILDAASEKRTPSEFLSKAGQNAIQGKIHE